MYLNNYNKGLILMKVKFTDLYKLIRKKKCLSKLNYLIKNSKFGKDEVKNFEKNFINIRSKYCILLAMVQMHLRLQ